MVNLNKQLKNMTLFQQVGYIILGIIALYLAYVVVTSLMWFFWFSIKLIVFSTLFFLIVWFLRKQGFFDHFIK